MTPRLAVVIGAISMGAAVCLGAFGAHSLREQITPEALETFKTGGLYHMLASLGLMGIGVAGQVFKARITVPAWLLFFGMMIFAVTLYCLAITGIRWLGAITPIGGVLMILSWFWFAAVMREKSAPAP